MENLIFCSGCGQWFVIGDTASIFGSSDGVNPPEDKDLCKNCGHDLTDDNESYDSSDIIELLNKHKIVPEA